jgi:hypothetical protein
VRWQKEQRKKWKVAPVAVAPLTGVIARPIGMPADQLAVWDELAKHAMKAGTLTEATAEAFALGCRVMVLERSVALTNPAGADHRGVLQRVTAFLHDFGLAPTGKPMAQVEKPVDEWGEFDAPPLALVRGGK